MIRSWNFCKMHHQILFFFSSSSPVRWFQIPLEGLSFVKALATFGIIDTMDSFKQNTTKLVCLCWFTLKTLETMLIYACLFFKIRLVFHTLYLWNKVCDWCFFIFETSNLLSVCSRSLKKIYPVEHFHTNDPKAYMKKVGFSSHPKENISCLWHPGTFKHSPATAPVVHYKKSPRLPIY